MNTHSALPFLKLSVCLRINLKQILLSSLLIRQRSKATSSVQLGTDHSGQPCVHKESQGMPGKSAIALREPLKWNAMRLKAHKLAETINSHRRTNKPPGHCQTRGTGCTLAGSVASRPSLREHSHHWATSCHRSSPPSWVLFSIWVLLGLAELCQRALGREGLGCVRSSSSARPRPGLCWAVQEDVMRWQQMR